MGAYTMNGKALPPYQPEMLAGNVKNVVEFTLEKNQEPICTEQCGENQREIDTMAQLFKKYAQSIEKRATWKIYYTIKSKA